MFPAWNRCFQSFEWPLKRIRNGKNTEIKKETVDEKIIQWIIELLELDYMQVEWTSIIPSSHALYVLKSLKDIEP